MGIRLEISTSNEWYILAGDAQHGPYIYEQMLQMLQNKSLSGLEYVWSPHLESWNRISELPEYSIDRISRLAQMPENKSVFAERKEPRSHCSWSVLVHDDVKVFIGKIESVSAHGALVLIENPLFLPEQKVYIHIPHNQNIEQTFNVKAKVLSKRHSNQRLTHQSHIYYTLKFQEMSKTGKFQIQQFINKENHKNEPQGGNK